MSKLPFILKGLSVRKMPGLPRGLQSLQDLSANVNIITGANASGKSSAARAIQQLIWQNNSKGFEIDGSVLLDADTWEIKIDSEKRIVQKNGIEDQISGLPTEEGRPRYLLDLHNLIEDKEKDLAKEIAKQSIGGFDLDAAQKDLEYSSKVFIKSSKEFKSLQEAERNYKEVRDRQKELKRDEESLNDLKNEKLNAEYAKGMAAFYKKVVDYLTVKLNYDDFAVRFGAFSNSLAKLSGEEYQSIEEHEGQIEDANKTIDRAKEEIGKSEKQLEKLTIPEGGVADKIISEIKNRLEDLVKFENSIHDLEKNIAYYKSEELVVLKGFDNAVDPSKWKDIDLKDVGGLDKLLQDAHRVFGEREFLDAEIGLLEEMAKQRQIENQSSDIVTHGIKVLSEWLKEPKADRNGVPLPILVLISFLGVATALAILYFGKIGLLGLVLILAFSLYAFFASGKSSDSMQVREKDFIKSGLKTPSDWNAEAVANRIDELVENLAGIKEVEHLRQRLNTCRISLNKLQINIENVNAQREEWLQKLQSAPGFPESNTKDFSSMYWFLMQVKKWQDANSQKASWEAAKAVAIEQRRSELEKINALFKISNFQEITDAKSAKASIQELESQENLRKEHTRIVEQKEGEIANQEKLKKRSQEKLAEIYQSTGVPENDKGSVRALVDQLADYKQVEKEHYAAKQAYLSVQIDLQEHSLYKKHEEEIRELSIDLAQQKSVQNSEIAMKLEDIQKQITEIETLVQAKKKGHELEDVLNEKDRALGDLQLLFEKNISSVTGDLIITQLKKETQNKNRPEVFKQANKIFNKITNGRYELLIDDKGEPNFRAYDTVLKLGQDLSELSTGTRVQLLISVRLAYVETVEKSIKLPLLADELLANSDDERAKAIIESLIEISREGRQVFYFTAQADEVDKWMAHLQDQSEIDYKVFELTGGMSEFSNHSNFKRDTERFSLTYTIPAPNGSSHAEYGDIIRKLPFNILIQSHTELHLWYLVEDVQLLYAFLKRGIINWGQLESLFKIGGKIKDLNDETYRHFCNQIELLKRFQELYRIGRSHPINRGILEYSEAISASFIDRVSDKLEELNRDPRKLINALRNGEVSGFRINNTEKLELYLLSEGYIDDEEVLTYDEILIQMHAFVSNTDMRIEDATAFLDRILKEN